MAHRLDGAWRLRWLAFVAILVFAAITTTSVMSLLWIARLSRETTDAAIRHTAARGNASHVHASLLTHQHLGNLAVLSDEPHVRESRDEAAAEVRRRVELAAGYIATPQEAVIVEELTVAVEKYLYERERAEAEA